MPATTVPQQADADVRNVSGSPDPGLPKAVEEAASVAKPEDLDAGTVVSATDWFLSQEVEPVAWDTFDLNVSSDPRRKKWVRFRIEAIDRDVLKQIRQDATDANTGMEDDVLSNEFVAIQALVDPDLSDPKTRGGMADPRDALRRMLGHKPLLIDAIARRAMAISGANTDDQRDAPDKDRVPRAAKEVGAAGN